MMRGKSFSLFRGRFERRFRKQKNISSDKLKLGLSRSSRLRRLRLNRSGRGSIATFHLRAATILTFFLKAFGGITKNNLRRNQREAEHDGKDCFQSFHYRQDFGVGLPS